MNIADILNFYHIPVAPSDHHHRTEEWEQIDCPFCSKNTYRWRMGIAKNGLLTRCWTCGSHSIYDTLMEITGESYHKIKELLFGLSTQIIKRTERKKGKLIIPNGVGPLLEIHKKYLKERNFNPKKLEKLWRLQGIGLVTNRYSWRIFIPVVYQGRTVSWTTRIPKDKIEPRYVNATANQEEISPKSLLFGEDLVNHAIVITEGPFDTIKIGPGAVSTMGLGWTTAQIAKMINYPVRVICFDSEKLAQKRAKELHNILEPFPGNTYRVELDAKDPGEASSKEIKLLRKSFLD